MPGVFENRETGEWFDLMNMFTSCVPAILAFVNWNKCDGIISLRVCLLLFSMAASTHAGIKFFARNPKKGHSLFPVMSFVGILSLIFGLWAVGVTYPDLGKSELERNCISQLYYSGVVVGSIMLFVVAIVVLWILYCCVMGKPLDGEKKVESESAGGAV